MNGEQTRHARFLPSGDVLDEKRRTIDPDTGKEYTWAAIAGQFGVSRQAAHKAWKKWRDRVDQAVAPTHHSS